MLHTFAKRSTEREQRVVEIENVPTARELAEMSKSGPLLARVLERNAKGVATVIAITDEGHALLGAIMRRNGRALAAAQATRPEIVQAAPITAAQAAHVWARDMFEQ